MYTSYPDVGEQKVVVFLFSIYWSSWYITTNIELFLKTNFSFNYVHVFYVWVLLSARRRDEVCGSLWNWSYRRLRLLPSAGAGNWAQILWKGNYALLTADPRL